MRHAPPSAYTDHGTRRRVAAWQVVVLAAVLAVAGLAPAAAADAATDQQIAQPLTHTVTRGPVEARVRLAPPGVPIGDEVLLELEVTAAPGVEVLLPEFGQSLGRFAILDFVPSSRVEADGRTLAIQRYRLQPLNSGQHVVPPLMIEFVDRRPGQPPAPEGEDAYELLTERIEFEVQPAVPASAATALNPPLGALETETLPDTTRDRTLVALLAVLIAAALAWLLWRRLRQPAAAPDAYALASKRLTALRGRPLPETAESMDGFFVELSDIVRHYVEDRYAVHAPELTTEEFLDAAARSPDLSSGHRQFLGEFLASADRVKFARFVPAPAAAGEALAAVAKFLDETRSPPEQADAGTDGTPAHA